MSTQTLPAVYLDLAKELSAAGAGDLAWVDRAVCAQTDPEAFFPEKGGSTREAKKVCLGCEVRAECLEYALLAGERFGIWGGLSERERRRHRSHTCADCGTPIPPRHKYCPRHREDARRRTRAKSDLLRAA